MLEKKIFFLLTFFNTKYLHNPIKYITFANDNNKQQPFKHLEYEKDDF